MTVANATDAISVQEERRTEKKKGKKDSSADKPKKSKKKKKSKSPHRRKPKATLPQTKGVQFHGVEVREYARSMGDNPSTEHGPPLSLDWEYNDITREKKPFLQEINISNYFPCAAIPIDDYEKETDDRRRAKLTEMRKLQEKSSNNSTLTEEQMKQLSAHWLKIQPLTAQERMRIIRKHTDITLKDIEEHQRALHKTRMQRKSSTAAAESGVDDIREIIEFFKRRYRRYKSGISKEREQEMLWENAASYWGKDGKCSSSCMTSDTSLTSSISSTSRY